MNKQSKTAKILMLAISIVLITLGLTAILGEHAPDRWTRYGHTAALFGNAAKLYGAILLMMSLLPLLIFCKTAKQAAVIGSILFLLLMTTIFGGIYLVK